MRDILYIISRWLLFLIILFLAVYLFYAQIYLVYGPKIADVDARLPALFHSTSTTFWLWFLGSGLLGGGGTYWILRTFRRLRSGPTTDPAESDEADSALASACAEVANLRRGHERDPAYLIIAEGDAPLSLMAAAGLGPDAIAPQELGSIRGLRTADGLFIQCVGPDANAARAACRVLTAFPGAPPLRGIIVQVPVATLLGPKSHAFAHAARGLLRDVAESIPTRCPVYVLISGMEEVAGFLEFAHRSPPEYRTSARFGFSVPGGDKSSPEAVAREYDRLIAWYNLAILDFMEIGPLEQESNEALYSLGCWFLQIRKPMLHFLEAAKAGGDDPLEMLNCYFAATGDAPERRAFVESLMRVKVAGDARSTQWALESLRADRVYRRSAIGLGAVGGVTALLAWALIFVFLKPTGWVDAAIALVILAGWCVGWYELLRGFRRSRNLRA